jgi:hypothetical protein
MESSQLLEGTSRRVGAAAFMAGSAGIVGWHALTRAESPLAIGFAALLAAAAFGFTRRSLAPQIAARGAAWLAFAPLTLLFGRLIGGGSVPVLPTLAALCSGSALLLARPLIHTEEAHRAFSPVRFRSLFLAGATVMTSAAYLALGYAWVGVVRHVPLQIAFNASLAVILFVSVTALLRMRAWGLLLGGFTSLVLLALTPFFGGLNAITLGLAAAPAILFWVLPVLLSRVPSAPEPAHVRVGLAERVSAPDDVDELELEEGASLQASRRC